MFHTLRPVVGMTAFVFVLGLAHTTQAALVIQSVIANVANDDLAGTSTFDVEIRAGVDSGSELASGFSLQLNASVSPVSVTEIPNTGTSGWRDAGFDYDTSVGLGSPQVRVQALFVSSVAPPTTPIDFQVGATEALIGTYQFVFSRAVGSDLPVSFDLSPISFLGSGDPSGQQGFIVFELGDGVARLDTFPNDYSSAAGAIPGLTPVPEPGSLVLLAVGCLGLIRRRAR